MISIFTPEDITALQDMLYPVVSVVVLILLDIISGVIKAVMQHNLNSSKMRTGLGHKAAYIMLIILFAFVQIMQIHFKFWDSFPTVAVVCALICVCEVISVLENICVINPEIGELPLIKELLNNKVSDSNE